jgi:hypothetical protein
VTDLIEGPGKITNWFTPAWLIDRIHEVCPISFDPATEEGAPWKPPFYRTLNGHVVPIGSDASINGVMSRTAGDSIWFLNPPYGRKLLTPFLEEATASEYPGVMLLPVRTSTKWWRTHVAPFPRMYFNRRIAFLHPTYLTPVKGTKFDSALVMVNCSAQQVDSLVYAFKDLCYAEAPYNGGAL